MGPLTALMSSAVGTCAVVFALLYAFAFVGGDPWAKSTAEVKAPAAEVQGVTSRGVPAAVSTPVPSVPAPTATIAATPTSLPTPAPEPPPPALDDEDA
jgi:cell division septation protein DedD